MKRILLFAILSTGAIFLMAQSNPGSNAPFYYFGDQKIYLKNSTQKIFLRRAVGETGKIESILKSSYHLQDKDIQPLATENVLVIDLNKKDAILLQQVIINMQSLGAVESVKPAIVAPDGKTVVIDDGFYVKLKPTVTFLQLQNFVAAKNCILQKRYEYDTRTYLLKAGAANNYDGLLMANIFYESGFFEYAEPDFQTVDRMNAVAEHDLHKPIVLNNRNNDITKNLSTPNDPLFNYQWWAKNDGTSIQYNGVAGADIDLDEAWDITQGSPTIRIAVIDEGVDRDHPDLINNIDPMGFGLMASVATTGDVVSSSLSHGTSCAGIVAAQANNGIGIAGVAPLCKIIPVSVVINTSGNYASSAQLAQCIDWAWNNAAADVLSNSWGGGVASSLVHDAILRAVTLGRSGKGAIVVFCTQNYDAGISSPSVFKETIAVGAMSMCEQRKSFATCDGEYWWGGNYGVGLDISAPGVKIATTKNVGTGTAPNVDYNLTFNGTSSATPMVSGVAGLILSLNPNFTETQVRQIIEQSARKVPGYSYSNVEGQPYGFWNSDLGYGMLNAKNALLLAQNPVLCNVEVARPNTLQACSGNNISLQVSNANAGDSYQWRKDGSIVATGVSYAATQTGDYDVMLTTSAGCKDTSYKFSVLISLSDGPLVADAGNDTTIVPNAKIFLGGGPAGSGGTGILHPMRGFAMDITSNRFIRFDPEQPGERFKTITENFIPNPQTNQFYSGAAVTPFGLYMIDRYSFQLVKVDTATGATFTVGAATNSHAFNSMCYDPSTGKIFATAKMVSNNNGLFEINRKTGEATFIAEITNASLGTRTIISLSANTSGQLFAVNLSTSANASAQLFSINKSTGAATLIGNLNFLSNFAQDGAIDPISNQLYQCANTSVLPYNNGITGRGLWKVNTATGATTLIGSIAEPFFTTDALGIANKEYRYQWSPATYLSNPNDAHPQFSTATPGIYPYTLTITDLCGNTTTGQVIITVSVAAPVTLLSFNGIIQNNAALLKWNIQNEINFDKYEIERSVTGLSFEKIGQVKATGAANYRFTDDKLPQADIIYYRLKMMDIDGRFKYSEIIKLATAKIIANRLIAVSPNPFDKTITIQYESMVNENIQVSLISSKGELLLKQNAKVNKGVNYLNITTPQLVTGIYFLKLQAQGEIFVQKVKKQ